MYDGMVQQNGNSGENKNSRKTIEPDQSILGPTWLSNVEKKISFLMVIQHPVVRIVNKENCLKNHMTRKFGVNITCCECSQNAGHTVVELVGGSGSIFDAGYDGFLHISQLQTYTKRIRENNIIQMWKTWNKRDKILFFLETNTFIADDTNIVQGFKQVEIINARTKLKKYSTSEEKPIPLLKHFKQILAAKVVGSSTETRRRRTKKGQKHAHRTITIEVENGKDECVAELITDPSIAHMKKMQNLYENKVNIETSTVLVVVELTADSDAILINAEEHVWKTLRSIQDHQRTYFLTADHGWRQLRKEEKINFLSRMQVTVEEDGSKLLLKGFLLRKLALAVDSLEAKRNRNGKSVITLELENGDERRVGETIIGRHGAAIQAIEAAHGTRARIISSPSLVLVDLKGKNDESVWKAEQDIWNRIRPLQDHECEYPISEGHSWRRYTEKERIQFQTETQVTVELDGGNEHLILKAFLEEKLPSAMDKLG